MYSLTTFQGFLEINPFISLTIVMVSPVTSQMLKIIYLMILPKYFWTWNMLLVVNIYCFNVLLLNDRTFLVCYGFWQCSRAFENNYQPFVYIMITGLILILKWIVPKVANIWNVNFIPCIPLFANILQIHLLKYIELNSFLSQFVLTH